ncbi:MAG: phage tail tape measure protein, partial [Candidatus Subteraquimicrobiales bacterium]|nr:phage tail tape measure protein [Candidatus Subteraquimicrobiales bacterium]
MISKASDAHAAGGGKGSERRLDFVIGIANMTWPGIAAVQSGFANLTAAGMRTTNILNEGMGTLSAGMMAAGGAAALAIGIMTVEAAKFEKQMKVVQSLIQEVDDSPMTIQTKMAELTKTAKQLAVEYGMSPVKVAEGLGVLGRAGVTSAEEINTVMKAAIQLSKIEAISVSEASEMTVQMTTLFGGTMARDATKFAEIIAHAANISTTSAKEIMIGMRYAGGIASSIWGNETAPEKYDNASQMAAMIATLSQQGVSGPMAGTAIKSFVNYMVKGMPKSKRALAQIGLSEEDFKDAEGNFLRLPAVIDVMQSKINRAFRDPDGGLNEGKMYQWFVKWGEPRQAQQYMKMFAPGKEAGTHMIDEYVAKMEKEYSMQ